MTNEDAIKNIKEHCYFANLIPRAKEALDMAIKALEQGDVLREIRQEIDGITDTMGVSYYPYISKVETLEIIDTKIKELSE